MLFSYAMAVSREMRSPLWICVYARPHVYVYLYVCRGGRELTYVHDLLGQLSVHLLFSEMCFDSCRLQVC